MTDKESWQDIEDYEGGYQISTLGMVKSFKGIKERILKPGINTGGYYIVGLHKGGEEKTWLVSRLVALAFIPNPENKKTVNHKWGNKLDNRASQLEWNSHSENCLHAFRELGRVGSATGKFGKEHHASKAVSQYTKSGKFIKTFESQLEAQSKTGIDNRKISHVCTGNRKTAGGYIWKKL